jgi:ABC-type antimicrobial peptide transport system permease subunit
MYYLPVSQFGANLRTVFVRLRGASVATRTEEIRRALQPVMPAAGYLTVQPLTNVLERETRSWRLGATMFAVFGGLALMLAAIGLYSVIAYSVTQRTHEMGVRVALGARIGDVVALIVGDGLRVVVVGVAIGLTIALTAGHWIAPLLFGVSARDPFVFSAVAVALVAVALIASWVPAMRASRVDPATALRAD